MEALSAITAVVKEAASEAVKKTAKETLKEVATNAVKNAESSFPRFFDSGVKVESFDGVEKAAKDSDGGKFPEFFNKIDRVSVDWPKESIGPSKQYDPNKTMEVDGHAYEKDDNGNVYKVDGNLNPESNYVVNKISYQTDTNGRIISWEGEPGYNLEAERDGEAQTDAGGKDRKPGDDGGHLVARILNGSSGNENIVAMRDTINRGDYKKSENEIANAKIQGKEVRDSGKLSYEGESSRPDKIERTYVINDIKKELTVDNVEGSKDLLNDIKDDVSVDDYQNLEYRIQDMEEDGTRVSVTSVLKEYDINGNVSSVTVGIRDEISKIKTYVKIEGR